MKLSKIIVDTKAQEEGEWRDHPYFDGVSVCVRSIHSEAYRKRRAALMNRLPRKSRPTGDAVALQEDINDMARDALLAGWKGIEGEGENAGPIEFSPELAKEWAADDQYRRFFDGVYELALSIGEAEQENDRVALGN